MLSDITVNWILDSSMVEDIHQYFDAHPDKFTSKQRIIEKTLYAVWSTHPYPNEAELMYCRVLDLAGILQYKHMLDMGYEIKYNRLQKRV